MFRVIIFLFLILPFSNIGLSQTIDTTTIKVSSSNLSEDMKFSLTKDDELLLLVYNNNSLDNKLSSPITKHGFNFNDSIKESSFKWIHAKDSIMSLKLFLIEIDSDKTISEIEPSIRIHHAQLEKCFLNKDYGCIQNYIGDEDILGVKEFSIPTSLNIKGIHKLDKYEYSISFQ